MARLDTTIDLESKRMMRSAGKSSMWIQASVIRPVRLVRPGSFVLPNEVKGCVDSDWLGNTANCSVSIVLRACTLSK